LIQAYIPNFAIDVLGSTGGDRVLRDDQKAILGAVDDARKRGKRAEKLFNKTSVMGEIIKACETGDFGAFEVAVRKELNASAENITEMELADFINEMWAAGVAARAYHENKPCW